jgi:hypothetical protein
MIHQEYFNKLVNVMTSETYIEEVKKARAEYIKIAGEVFEDDKSFEMRMTSFLEWYILDRHINAKNKTPLKIYLDEYASSINDEEREFFSGLINTIHSIFEIKGQKKEFIKIRDLFSMENHLVSEDNINHNFRKRDIVEAKIFPFKGKYLFSNAFCFHPKTAGKFIGSEFKKMKKDSNPAVSDFILRLSYMNLKWERARGIDAKEIYR